MEFNDWHFIAIIGLTGLGLIAAATFNIIYFVSVLPYWRSRRPGQMALAAFGLAYKQVIDFCRLAPTEDAAKYKRPVIAIRASVLVFCSAFLGLAVFVLLGF